MDADNQLQPAAPDVGPDAPDLTAAPAAVPVSRRGGFLRGCVTICIIAGVLLLILYGIVQLTRGGYQHPLAIAAYPSITKTVNHYESFNLDDTVYATSDPITQVAAFYSGRLGTPDPNGSENGCARIYYDKPPLDAPGRFYYRCITDVSFLDAVQTAQVSIALAGDGSGQTWIEVKRTW